jgi:hypothetical protein
MNRIQTWTFRLTIFAIAAPLGCGMRSSPLVSPGELLHYQNVAELQVETPNLKPCADDPALATLSPEIINENGPVQYWDMKLADAMQTALARSKVMHDLGGAELRTPAEVRTISDPAIADTDPRYGVEAALSDYDAVFNSSVDSQHNHRALNNIFFGGGTRILIQDLDTFKNEIVKETPTGTQFTFRQNTVYDNNNEPGNLFPSAWDTNFEAEFRQHLLQGGGVEYNRIAGPHGSPGQLNGVLIARINTDVALTDFELGIRDLASNVENAYWDLYFAYRDLDAKVLARDNALESWRRTNALNLKGRRGGEAEKEAQVRQQYFQFQEEVENAWNGRLLDATHTDDGSGGGTFRGIGGVRVAERRLRRLLGLPISDGRLIRPADEPALAKMIFAWQEILPEALTRRAELRRQRWQIKRRELELIASRNFLLPTLDATGLYRFRGFGHDLINTDPNQPEFASAFDDLATGKFQEWELGAQFSMPLGERKGHAAVRNAQLNLARERAILADQEQLVVHDLSNALAEVDRAYSVAQTAYNRRIAARTEVGATKAAFEADKVPLDLFLEAQRRQADAESGFFGALVEYALAIKNLHYAKGSLLDYNEIYLSEGPWPDKAYADAAKLKPKKHELLDYRMKPMPIGAGPIPQPAGSELPLGFSQEPAEGVPPGAEIRPMPPSNAPWSAPSNTPSNGPTTPPPLQIPSAPPPSIPPPFAPPQSGPPQPLPPASSLELSPTSQQQPDLQPHNERMLSPAVQPAMSRPMAMDELVASQPPPAAFPTAAPRATAPAIVASAGHAPDTSTLSIYSRGSILPSTVVTAPLPAPAYSPANTSQIRMVTQTQSPANLQPPKPTDAPATTGSEASPSAVRSAAGSDSNGAPRASWPESTIQIRPPVDRIDCPTPQPPTSVEGSIWTRASVQPASYPAPVPSPATGSTLNFVQPLPPLNQPASQVNPIQPLPPFGR